MSSGRKDVLNNAAMFLLQIMRSNGERRKGRWGMTCRRAGNRCLLFALASGIAAVTAHAAIPQSERAVLQNLYAYTDGDNWFAPARSGWNGSPGTECQWHGVTCNAQGDSVIAIRLAGASLYGSLPPLSGLSNLEVFDVRTSAPGGFSTGNRILGMIPPLSGLTRLREFRADNNSMSGPFPSLKGLNDLRVFECIDCGLSGPLPPLSGHPQLEIFDVSWNQLTGDLPALTGLTKLRSLNIGQNRFNGELPAFADLPDLEAFYAHGNLFSGNAPDLVDLPKLTVFWVSGILDGHIGDVRNLPSLVTLEMDGSLIGSLPDFTGTPRLRQIFLQGNRLTGNVPDLAGLPELEAFDISFNQIEGALPAAPASLVAAANANGAYPSAGLCPNRLTPATTPPTSVDLGWDAATMTMPWSQDCVPDPRWKTRISIHSDRDPTFAGQTATFTAVVRGMNPTGTFTFIAQDATPFLDPPVFITLCENVPLVDSMARCAFSDFPAHGPPFARYKVRGQYSGDAENEPQEDDLYTYADQYILPEPIAATTTANPAQIGKPVEIVGTAGPGDDDDRPMFFYDGQALLCGDVPVHEANGRKIGRCTVQFTTPGPHSIIFLRNPINFVVPGHGFVPLIQEVVPARRFDADQFALSGSWYNPATSGQGLQIEVYPDRAGSGVATLFGNWFTYDDAGHQQWLVMQGNLAQSHGASFDLTVGLSAGGNFDAPPIVPAVAIGSATMTFVDCSHAALTFTLDDGRSGTIPYVRLTSPSACSTTLPALPPVQLPENYNDVLHSGAWYEPATSGQGLMVDIVPSTTTFFAAWFTFAPQADASIGVSRQRWFTLQDDHYTPGTLSMTGVPIIATTGGVFNQPSSVERSQVGTADIRFTSCTTMTLAYTFTSGEFSGLTGTIDERIIAPNPACR